MINIDQDMINDLRDCVDNPNTYPDQFIRGQIVRCNCIKTRLHRKRATLSAKELELSKEYNKLTQKLYKVASARGIFVDRLTIDAEEEASIIAETDLENSLKNGNKLLKNFKKLIGE